MIRRRAIARPFVYPLMELPRVLETELAYVVKLPTDVDLDARLRNAGLCDHHAPPLAPLCSLCVDRRLPAREC